MCRRWLLPDRQVVVRFDIDIQPTAPPNQIVPMPDSRIDLRNSALAALLAFLFPGAGHLYQRRYFKAAIYCFCILGIYVWGCSLGEAKAVHLRLDKSGTAKKPRQRTIGYLAQVGIGLPALPAAAQFLRHRAQEDLALTAGEVIEDFDTEFTGRVHTRTDGHMEVVGQLNGELRSNQYASGTEFEGRLTGQTTNGKSVDLLLHGYESYGNVTLEIGPRICGLDDITTVQLTTERVKAEFSGSRRRFLARVVDPQDYEPLGLVEGTIPRGYFDQFQAPLSDEAMQHLNGKLGRYYELALVYTWIAGLLNILAVWDAMQGPAYGYGDEVPEETTADSDKKSPPVEPAAEKPGAPKSEPVVAAAPPASGGAET
jgi:hypothetical protein